MTDGLGRAKGEFVQSIYNEGPDDANFEKYDEHILALKYL